MSQLWSGSHIRRANSVSTPGSHRTLEPRGRASNRRSPPDSAWEEGEREAAEFLSQLPATDSDSLISLSLFFFNIANICIAAHFRMNYTCCGKRDRCTACGTDKLLLLLSEASLTASMESVSLVFWYCDPRPGIIPVWVGGMSQSTWWSCGTNASCKISLL